MNMGDSRVLHLCVENDALVTNGLIAAYKKKHLFSTVCYEVNVNIQGKLVLKKL